MKQYWIVLFLLGTLLLQAQLQQPQRPKIGLVLSGGGAKGVAHIGALKVIEELDIPIDYITGTSMGSIIGGLYAIGYRADDLEHIITSQNWDELLFDYIPRSRLSFRERERVGRYAASFPIEGFKVSLPSGLVAGQNVAALLSHLTLSAHHIEDFNNLPIPFRCVATAIETGEAVVLKDGYLPDAIRASMSIPSAFSPVELDGQLLVDGGLVRNFPVQDARDMGADIIIGVDVSSPLYTRRQLNSLVRIMEQSVNFMGNASTQEQRTLCNIIIDPDVEDFSILDFSETDSLIARGEVAARTQFDQLKALSDSLHAHYIIPQSKRLTMKVDSLHINKIYIQGLRQVSTKLVKQMLQLKEDRWIAPKQLDAAIERVYGTQYFERVSYKLEPVAGGVDLFVRVIEKTSVFLNMGVAYDNQLNSVLMLNAMFRNVIGQGSSLSLDADIGENPSFKASYIIYTGWRPGLGFNVDVHLRNWEIPVYAHNDDKLQARFDYHSMVTNIGIRTTYTSSFELGGAIEHKLNNIEPDIVPAEWNATADTYNSVSTIAWLRTDTFNRRNFPTRGHLLHFQIQNASTVAVKDDFKLSDPVQQAIFDYQWINDITPRFSVDEGFKFALVEGDNIKEDEYIYLGGSSRYERNVLPFYGIKFMNITATRLFTLHIGSQWEFKDKWYLLTRYNYAKYTSENIPLTDGEDLHGYAFGMGVDLPIGPLKVLFSRSPERDESYFHVILGHRF